MEIGETLYVRTRKEFRAWLEQNHTVKDEIWLVYYKKHTGKPRIPYDYAVEEAICYGWIDSIVKHIDNERYCRRFTPWKGIINWSDLNITRMRKILEAGKMTEHGLAKVSPEVMKKV